MRIGFFSLIMLFVGVFLFAWISPVFADSVGQRETFFVDPVYDEEKRSTASASLRIATDRLYFYIEDKWWEGLASTEQNEVLSVLSALAVNFEEKTYPALTALFGTEHTPGIDGDEHITVLLHSMDSATGGYFRSADSYTILEAPRSNQREMFYFNPDNIGTPVQDSLFAHEFMHLIQLNQKERLRNIREEVWIQEGFAEIAPTIAGYNQTFSGSYLEGRVKDFLRDSRNSLIGWQGNVADYGVASMFFHYLLDQYGEEFLVDILHSSESGIESIEKALQKHELSKNFEEVFTDWTVAVFLNDCAYGTQYCYTSNGLEKLRVVPYTNFLPLFGESELTVTNQTSNWSGNWNKIGGGEGVLLFEFDGNDQVNFRVPYLAENRNGSYTLGFLKLDESQRGSVQIQEFGTEQRALFILPSVQDKRVGGNSYLFSWKARVVPAQENPTNNPDIVQLLQQIAELQAQVEQLRAQLAALQEGASCSSISTNLFYGMSNNAQVRCLQQVLRDEGGGIYPEGLVTGNFLSLTQQAAIRFQEKYARDILEPLGLERGTGFVGPSTRAKLNELLSAR